MLDLIRIITLTLPGSEYILPLSLTVSGAASVCACLCVKTYFSTLMSNDVFISTLTHTHNYVHSPSFLSTESSLSYAR